MHYIPDINLAFLSVEHIMRDVNSGWLLRYVHANGASMFFLVVYVHILRGFYYGSFLHPRQFLWSSGVIILLLMILTAFLGYVLPWGQMSFWAATVITNLASAVPYVGDSIVLWLWGGFAVDQATLNRFFSLHYLFPFIIAALAFIHVIFLHEHGSNNPLGISAKIDQIPFTPYFTIKDFLGVVLFLMIFSVFVFFYPNVLGHSDNYIPANPLVTPTHIVPEWYFLPFYAMLRSIPNKLIGVLVLVFSIIIMCIVPFSFLLSPTSRLFIYSPLYKLLFWLFFFNCLILGWIGGKSIETPYYEIGQAATLFYFMFFFFLSILEVLNFNLAQRK
jgi:ubiquinol-cytochrome c reductase cytochrome b subunit